MTGNAQRRQRIGARKQQRLRAYANYFARALGDNTRRTWLSYRQWCHPFMRSLEELKRVREHRAIERRRQDHFVAEMIRSEI